MCDILGSSALWSLCSVFMAVVWVFGIWGMSEGRRSSQWSNGEFVGMKVGVRGSPTWVSGVVVIKFVRGLQ